MSLFKIPKRKKYDDEKKYSWLSILLDSYAINDYQINLFGRREEQSKRLKIVCHKGCSNCCKNPMVPILDLIRKGISWYISEIMDYNTQEKIKVNISNMQKSTVCPFLVNDVCSIYEVRPLACRTFNVFKKICELNEDPFKTRPNEVLAPNSTIARKVAMRFLDYEPYQLKSKKEKEEAFENRIMVETKNFIHNIDWNNILWSGSQEDKKNPKEVNRK
ncbi:MAG: YkgJ family cysteine cluster protein [Bacteroidetes bacterium]|nr:YkgJ family cysteine cluster protein [Bacteroidota bacterium]